MWLLDSLSLCFISIVFLGNTLIRPFDNWPPDNSSTITVRWQPVPSLMGHLVTNYLEYGTYLLYGHGLHSDLLSKVSLGSSEKASTAEKLSGSRVLERLKVVPFVS